jgi:RND superfamily putative drug exporter
VGDLTRWLLRHRRLVALVWVVLALAGAGTASFTTKRLTSTFAAPGAPAFRADAAVLARYGGDGDPIIAVVTVPRGRTVADPSSQAVLAAASRAATSGGRYRVVSVTTSHDARFVTANGRTTFLLVFTPPAGFGSKNLVPGVTSAVRHALPGGWSEQTTGTAALQSPTHASHGNGVLVESFIGAAGALVILAVVFASALAVLPLLMAGVAIPVTFLLLLALTTVASISFVVQFLIALVGLGIAIDYSLLVTTRWREESARRSPDDAVVAAMESAGRSVVVSGTTVAIGLLSLVVIPVPFLRSMGIGGVLIPLVSVAAAVTLLPVCLASFGPRLDRHRLRRADSASPPWIRFAAFVTRHDVVAALSAAVILVLLVLPVTRLSVGQPVTASMARGGAAQAGLTTLREGGVPSGIVSPMQVLVRDPLGSRAPEVLTRRLGRVPGVWSVVGPSGPADERGGTALVTVLVRPEIGAPGGTAVVTSVRRAAAGDAAVIGVSGTGPDTIDFDHALYGRFPLLLVLVSLLTFVVLVRAFRSLLLAAKAVVCNLASLGSAYGVIVLVWQEGHGSRLLFGLPPTGTITNWVPIVVFAFLYGLAIDYEVFILTRMRESYDAGGDTAAAVVDGIGRTGRLVTSAALILTFAFVSLATAPLTFLKVLATGLAAGILVDAFVVRCLLVPSLVSLFGEWNWKLPAILGRLLGLRPEPPRVEPLT